MFHYISSGAIIILELICCKIFFGSFCDEQSEQNKEIAKQLDDLIGKFER